MRRLLLAAILLFGACGKEEGPEEDLVALSNRAISLLERYEEEPTAEAVRLLARVVEAAPDWRDARVNLAIALAATKEREDLERATRELGRVLAEDPRHPHALFHLALVKRFQGKPDEAKPLLERLAEVDPREGSVRYWLGTIELERDAGDPARAEAHFREALRLSPEDPSSLYGLVRALGMLGKGEDPEATALLERFQRLEAAKEFGSPALVKHSKRGDQEYGEGGPYAFAVRDSVPPGARPAPAPVAPYFGDATEAAGLGGVDATQVACGDVDGDGDDDLVVVDRASRTRLFVNDEGRFTDATTGSGLEETRGAAALLWDLDDDAHLDLAIAGDSIWMFRGRGDRTFEPLSADRVGFAATADLHGLCAADVDHDGDLDLAYAGDRCGLLLNRRDGSFAEVARERGIRASDARRVRALDLDGDGLTDLEWPGVGCRNRRLEPFECAPRPPPEAPAPAGLDFDGDHDLDSLAVLHGRVVLLRAQASGTTHHVHLRLRGVPDRVEGRTFSNARGVGAVVEVRAGGTVSRRVVRCDGWDLAQGTTDLVFPVEGRTKADHVRIQWTDGVLQSETDVPADRLVEIVEVNRKLASCPILFAWDGKEFRYVTDTLGVGGLGFYLGPSLGYGPPDPTEVVRIGRMEPKDGEYLVQMVENLEEVSYLDEARLLVVDHPASMEVHPDERFAADLPMPRDVIYGAERKVFPVAATDDRGRDVLPLLLEEDRRTVDGFERDRRFVGFAEPHALALDFGDRLSDVRSDERLVLFLSGWIEYGYSKTSVGTAQAGIAMEPPVLEVPDGVGGWRKAAVIGYPAGNSRTMTFDATGILGPANPRCRIRTNLEVYWDRVFLAADAAPGRIRVTTLAPSRADLHVVGYPREHSPDGRLPLLYDYARRDADVPFRTTAGDYTRLGNVTQLVQRSDDRFVIFGKGEEVTLAFPALAVPDLSPGTARTFLVRLDGWCKDRDPYTALGDTVEPLPFHAMSGYPYPPPERYPDDPEHREYRERWNTRRIR